MCAQTLQIALLSALERISVDAAIQPERKVILSPTRNEKIFIRNSAPVKGIPGPENEA